MNEHLDLGVNWVMIGMHKFEADFIPVFEVDPATLHVLYFLYPL